MVVEENWKRLSAELCADPQMRLVYVLGEVDTGKSTLATYLYREALRREPSGYIDADCGQSRVGPPATLGLLHAPHAPEMDPSSDTLPEGQTLLRFVGSTSPARNLLQTAAALRRLTDAAGERGIPREGGLLVVDSSGFVSGNAGVTFQLNTIELLRPDALLVMDAGTAAAHIARSFERTPGMSVSRVPVSSEARRRDRGERSRHRQERFRRYFLGAREQSISLSDVSVDGRLPNPRRRASYLDRLCALSDGSRFVVALGIVAGFDPAARELAVLAPPLSEEQRERIAVVQFGELYLASDGSEKGPPAEER
jgi:polynucleotide 5'-hydroxyl-kinase GRC3/NOL9